MMNRSWLSWSLVPAIFLAGCASAPDDKVSANTRAASTSSGWFAPKTVTLPAGTPIVVSLESALSTESNISGDSFHASLSESVSHDGKIVLPARTSVKGVVASATKGGRVKGVAQMSLVLTNIEAGAKTVDVHTSPVSFAAHTSHGKDAAKIGIGSGIGAAIGAIAGGGKGAAIGAAAGAGAGTGVVLGTRGDNVHVAPETKVTFILREPIAIPVS